MSRILLAVCFVLALLPLSCGGGADEAELKGKVSYKGKPVTVGSLSFTLEDGSKTLGLDINSDGTFEAPDGAPVGSYVVEYEPPFAEGPGDAGWEEAKDFIHTAVPEDFRAKVEPGENNIEIKLVFRRSDDGA